MYSVGFPFKCFGCAVRVPDMLLLEICIISATTLCRTLKFGVLADQAYESKNNFRKAKCGCAVRVSDMLLLETCIISATTLCRTLKFDVLADKA